MSIMSRNRIESESALGTYGVSGIRCIVNVISYTIFRHEMWCPFSSLWKAYCKIWNLEIWCHKAGKLLLKI